MAEKQSLGSRVRMLRRSQGLSIDQLAKRSGLESLFLLGIEYREQVATMGELGQIAKGLGLSYRDVTGETRRDDLSEPAEPMIEKMRKLYEYKQLTFNQSEVRKGDLTRLNDEAKKGWRLSQCWKQYASHSEVYGPENRPLYVNLILERELGEERSG